MCEPRRTDDAFSSIGIIEFMLSIYRSMGVTALRLY